MSYLDFDLDEDTERTLPSFSDSGSYILGNLLGTNRGMDPDLIFDNQDYPIGSEEEFLKHYFFGAGSPFVDFLVWVDVGVGFELIPYFEDSDYGQKLKEEFEEKLIEEMDIIGTLMIFAVYYYTIGRGVLVETRNLAGDDFYIDKKRGIMGIDPIDPTTLDNDSIELALSDPTGLTPFKQLNTLNKSNTKQVSKDTEYIDEEGNQINDDGLIEPSDDYIPIARDRIIYRTRNPLSRVSVTGFSIFQNCSRDLQTAAKFPRYRNQLSSKYANLHRHYVINTEVLKLLEGGLDILSTKAQQEEYLTDMFNMINEQMQKGASVVTFDFVDSRDISFGGSEPDIGSIEKSTYESIGFKTGIPITLMLFQDSVNRSTLDTIGQFFIDKRKNGPQRMFKDIIKNVVDSLLAMRNITNGYFKVKILPFLNESKDAVYSRAVNLESANIPMSELEKRREVNLPDEIEYGSWENPKQRVTQKKEEKDNKLDEEEDEELNLGGGVNSQILLDNELGIIPVGETISKELPLEEPDPELGEGEATPEELEYRKVLLAFLASAGQNIRYALRQNNTPEQLIKATDKAISELSNQQKELEKHIRNSHIKGRDKALNDLRNSPLSSGDIRISEKGLNNLIKQQKVNLEAIQSELKHNIRNAVYIQATSSGTQREMEKSIESSLARAKWRTELTGMYGITVAENDAYRDIILKANPNLLLDMATMDDKRVCPKCISESLAGPYPASEATILPSHVGCRCKWVLSTLNWKT